MLDRRHGTMEFSGLNTELDRLRIDNLKSAAAAYLREPIARPAIMQWVHCGLSAQIGPAQHPVLTMRLVHKRRFGILRPLKSKFLSFKSLSSA